MAMTLREAAKWLSYKLFLVADRLGCHILPKHYYTPVPDHAWLRRNKHLWAKPVRLCGVHWDLDEQMRWLSAVCSPYYPEVAGLEFYRGIARDMGAGFGEIESQVLHCFVRQVKPHTIIEIGSGFSTACMLRAAQLNEAEGHPKSAIVCIEPHARAAFRGLQGIEHIALGCQEVPLETFARLGPGDLLFVDSSHTVKVGSEVHRIYLEIIPSLPRGVFIHVHDIYLPYLYSSDVLEHYFGWQETSLLLALLTGNDSLAVRACLAALHHDRPEALGSLLSDYVPGVPLEHGLLGRRREDGTWHLPTSMWLETC